MAENIDKLLQDLKNARVILEEVKEKIRIATVEFENREDMSAHAFDKRHLSDLVTEIELKIKDIGAAEFAAHGNKTIHEKVKVKMMKVFKVIDPAKVHKWVWDNFTLALKPDMKMVEDYVKNNAAFDGVELTEVPQVQIAKEL